MGSNNAATAASTENAMNKLIVPMVVYASSVCIFGNTIHTYLTLLFTNTDMYTCTYTHTYTPTHIHTHTHTHAYTHTRAYTHIHKDFCDK